MLNAIFVCVCVKFIYSSVINSHHWLPSICRCPAVFVCGYVGVKGGWKSSSRALQVDSQTGEAHAVAVGQSSLSYQISPDIVTNTEVCVQYFITEGLPLCVRAVVLGQFFFFIAGLT